MDYEYHFEGELVTTGKGDVKFTVVYVPQEITSQLEFGKTKRLRIDGEINGVQIDLAIMPQRGKWFLLVSKQLQKQSGLANGDIASVSFDVADQDAVHVPRELQYALEANERALSVWEGLTPGKRRGWCFRVDSAKRSETRERRALEVVEQLLAEWDR